MLTIAAIVLLALVTINVYKIAIGSQKTFVESEISSRAIYIGQSFIEEAKTKYFDAFTANGPITGEEQLTSPSVLKYEGESYPNFNDVDDYNEFDKNVTDEGNRLMIDDDDREFRIQISVFYVDKNSGGFPNAVSYKTYQKRFKVTISNNSLPQSIVLNHIFAYF